MPFSNEALDYEPDPNEFRDTRTPEQRLDEAVVEALSWHKTWSNSKTPLESATAVIGLQDAMLALAQEVGFR